MYATDDLNTDLRFEYHCNKQTSLRYPPHLHAQNIKLTKLFCTLCSRDKQDRTSSADDWTSRWCVNNVRCLVGTSMSVSVWCDAPTLLPRTK